MLKVTLAGTLRLECRHRSPGELLKMQNLIWQVWGGA